jgi:hypothetical protein
MELVAADVKTISVKIITSKMVITGFRPPNI